MTATTDRTSDGRMDEVEELRRELQRKKKYVRDKDPELYQAISEWCMEAVRGPVRGVRVLVRRELSKLARVNKMRDHRGVDDPAEAFPDACEGCEHYKIACPMLKNHLVKVELDRILEDTEGDVEAREKIYDLATRQGCHVLQDELEDFDADFSEFIARGYSLRNRIDAMIVDDLDPEDLPDPDEFDGAVPAAEADDRHEPPAEVEDRVEAVLDAVEADVAADGGEH